MGLKCLFIFIQWLVVSAWQIQSRLTPVLAAALLAQLTPDLKKCYHERLGPSIMKVVVGLALQVLCSYITFPLYALVTQVKRSSHMKNLHA